MKNVTPALKTVLTRSGIIVILALAGIIINLPLARLGKYEICAVASATLAKIVWKL